MVLSMLLGALANLLMGGNVLSGQPALPVLDLWPKGNPDGWSRSDKETIQDAGSFKIVLNVSHPTMTLYLCKGAMQGTPMILVCPGGGYGVEAYEHEGIEIAERLNKDGFNAALLKYRLPKSGEVRYKVPLQDTQRAIRILRSSAAQYGLDPKRIGIMGFSAGGDLSAITATTAEGTYTPVDNADQVSPRPDFAVLIYPAYLDEVEPGHPGTGKVAPEVHLDAQTPPTFLVQAMDDMPYITGSLAFATACQALKVPLEVHLFPSGGHGYGLRSNVAGLKEWPDRLVTWLHAHFPNS
jgi:acetyl esterase/lipase